MFAIVELSNFEGKNMAEKAKKTTKAEEAKPVDKKEAAKAKAKAGLGKLKNGGNGFKEFVKEQNVVGLAVGLILGTAAKGLIDTLINKVVMPPLGLLLGSTKGLEGWTIPLGDTGAVIGMGEFLSVLIDFLVLALVVYIVIKALKLDSKK